MQRWEELELKKEEGREEGRDSMARLITILLKENRIDDCKKGAEDKKIIDCIREIKIRLHVIEFAHFAFGSSRQERNLHRALHT